MMPELYGTLAGVYEWLLPDSMVTPQGSVAAFTETVDQLDAGARVLDCAAGTGQLAVALALRGFDVTASDASSAMMERTRLLATAHGVDLRTVVCPWDQLLAQGWSASFDVVWCVGNSIAHAPGQAARREALRQMAGVLRPGGLLVVTSRNWELVRAAGSRLTITEQLVERARGHALVVYGWSIAEHWDYVHHLDIGVALIDPAGAVTSHIERLPFWPFRHDELELDLGSSGLSQSTSTYDGAAEQYLVTAMAVGG